MARRSSPPEPTQAHLTAAQKKAALTKIRRRIQDLEGFNPRAIADGGDPSIGALEQAIGKTLVNVFGHNTVDYLWCRSAAHLDRSPLRINYRTPIGEVHKGLQEGKDDALATLREIVRGFEEDLADEALADAQTEPASPQVTRSLPGKRVFDTWSGDGKSPITSFALVTTEPADSIRYVHHRMPLVLDEAQFETWMRGTPDEAAALMLPYMGELKAWEVSTNANRPANNGPSLIEPLASTTLL